MRRSGSGRARLRTAVQASRTSCWKMERWRENWSVASWRDFLSAGETESELAAIRQCTHTGRPLGTKEFVKELEEMTRRQLAPRKGGRRAKLVTDPRQEPLEFDC